jgi:hypothetical protein
MPSHRPEDPDILAALETVQEGPSLTERAIPMALRVGGAIAGGIAGVPAGPPGIMALGAGGAGLGEIAAQAYEQRHDLRERANPTQVVVQAGLGAIPAGRALGSTVPGIIAARGVQGGFSQLCRDRRTAYARPARARERPRRDSRRYVWRR